MKKGLIPLRRVAYMVFNRRESLYHVLSIGLELSVRRVKMPTGLVAGPRRFHIVLERDQAYLLNISFLIRLPLHACYDYGAELML